MSEVIILGVIAVVCFIASYILGKVIDRRVKEERLDFIEKTLPLYKYQPQEVEYWINIVTNRTTKESEQVYNKYVTGYNNSINLEALVKDYPDFEEDKLIDLVFNSMYFLGMTPDMLVKTKGEPTKVEIEEMKTKTKTTYIYGNKSSGDIFVFEKGLLTRFKDR